MISTAHILNRIHHLAGAMRIPFYKLRHNSFGKDNFITEYVLLHGCKLGNYNYIGNYSVLNHTDIGNYCSIASHCVIGGEEHAYWDYSTSDRLSQMSIDGNRTKIGNDVWIGANCYIRQGITIGDGAVVGANSLVLHDVEPYTIVVGSPAKLLKKRFSDEMLDILRSHQYYDLSQEDARNLIKYLHTKYK